MPWYMENQMEYLVRYFSSDFLIEVADVPYPPYENFLERFPETHPLQRNPDDYDLIVPMLATHWGVTEKEKYRHKIAQIWYQPNEADADGIADLAVATPLAEKSITDGKHYHSVRFGVDTNIFTPRYFKKEKDILHVGMVGNLYNPRRMTRQVIEALKDLKGVRLMLFVVQRPKTEHDLELLGGKEAIQYIVSGEKTGIGLANLYNRLDVLIRCDSDPGYSFPVLEAAACRVPVIATDSGIDHHITDAGGGMLIEGDRHYYQNNEEEIVEKIRNLVMILKDNPELKREMGTKGYVETNLNWRWENFFNNWEDFFNCALERAERK